MAGSADDGKGTDNLRRNRVGKTRSPQSMSIYSAKSKSLHLAGAKSGGEVRSSSKGEACPSQGWC